MVNLRTLALLVLCGATRVGAHVSLGTPPFEVTPGERAKSVPLNTELRMFGTLAKTPDAGWALFDAQPEEVPCEVTSVDGSETRLVHVPRVSCCAPTPATRCAARRKTSRIS